MLLTQSNPAFAKFGGTLRRDVPWTLEITPAISPGVIAATIIFVDSRGRQDIDLFTIQPGESLALYSAAKIARGTRRIIIELDPQSEAAFQLRVIQGTDVIAVDVSGESSRVVFDVE
jgi:hypothetical protein